MLNKSSGLVWTIFLFCALLTTNLFGQDSSCAVEIEVTPYNQDKLIFGVSAKAVNLETNKIYNSVLRNQMPYFSDLPEGNYRVTVTKAGYMQSADDFSLYCDSSDNEDNAWSIELYKGSSTKIVRIYNRRYNETPRIPDRVFVIGDSDTTSVNPEKSRVEIIEEPPPPPPPPPPPKVPKVISGGVVNGKAISLPKPAYPPAALAVGAKGAVNVAVKINEEGNVVSAAATSGHPLLRAAAVAAARQAKFAPIRLSGQPVSVTGVIVYNFVPPEPKKDN